ncbi:unnamed protein product [Polarella glacialis]|uniref:Zeta toxin domain-containing protein n=1 Tax=Polarella glacialis TaxID=89957 RepID=A0A813JXH8_POLGL|nr:unnamed protein product [Polarella glacialis]CAE8685237.1 unnamed protein product [Polarella glacialis]
MQVMWLDGGGTAILAASLMLAVGAGAAQRYARRRPCWRPRRSWLGQRWVCPALGLGMVCRRCFMQGGPRETAAMQQGPLRVRWKVDQSFDFSQPTSKNYHNKEGQELAGPFADIRGQLDFSYHGCYSLERQALQDEMLKDVLGGAVPHENPWIVFTAGAMGAGKSHMVRWMSHKGYFPVADFVQIDLDRFRMQLPEWKGYVKRDPLTAGSLTHKESGYCAEIAQEAALRAGKNVWEDGSLRDADWYSALFRRIRREHPQYRIAILHVTASFDTLHARANARAVTTGRQVPEQALRASFEEVPKSVLKLLPLTDFWARIENEAEPRLEAVSSDVPGAVEEHKPPPPKSWEQIQRRFAMLPALQQTVGQSSELRQWLAGLVVHEPVLIFSKTYCSYCQRAKQLLEEELSSSAYYTVELDVLTQWPQQQQQQQQKQQQQQHQQQQQRQNGNSSAAQGQSEIGVAVLQKLSQMTGLDTVPQIFIGGSFVGGCDQLEELRDSGKLHRLLAAATRTTTTMK